MTKYKTKIFHNKRKLQKRINLYLSNFLWEMFPTKCGQLAGKSFVYVRLLSLFSVSEGSRT